MSRPALAAKPLAIELFAGLFGWGEGLIAEGWQTVGFDIVDMHRFCGIARKPEHRLVLQDVLSLHGSQFRDASLIVASPPCQAYSYRAMPWSRAKALPPPDNSLFNACFRIQREACEAAGRHIPMVVENVMGAQKWVGRARWNYGSFYLWGDVPALMPLRFDARKVAGVRFDGSGKSFQTASVEHSGIKGVPHRTKGHWTNPAEHGDTGVKAAGNWWADPNAMSRTKGRGATARKMASAMIAKIPLPLSRHIARTFYPREAA